MNFGEDVVVFIWSVVPICQNCTKDAGTHQPNPHKSFVSSFASIELRGSLPLKVRQSIYHHALTISRTGCLKNGTSYRRRIFGSSRPREELPRWRAGSSAGIFSWSELDMGYVEIIFGVFHFGLSDVLVHVVAIVRLVKPTLLQSVEHLDFLQAIGHGRHSLFESHSLINIRINK